MRKINNMGDMGDLFTELGSLVTASFKNVVTQFIASIQSKVGQFLSAKARIYAVRTNLTKFAGVAGKSDTASILQARADELLVTQGNLETTGGAVIGVISAVQSDPVIQKALSGTFPSDLNPWNVAKTSGDWYKLETFINNVNTVRSNAGSFLGMIDVHLANVTDLENQYNSLAGVGVQAGEFIKKYGMYILFGIGLVTKGFGFYKTAKRK